MDTLAWIELLQHAALAFAAVIAVLLPWELLRLHRRGQLNRASILEMLASASPVVPAALTGGLVTAFVIALYTGVAALVPWSIPTNGWTAMAALVAVDFMYYWDHRTAHRNRLYWAIAHSVHHSSPRFDQTTGLRVSFVDGFISPWFYVPVVAAGFDPLLVGACLALIIGWQQWLHTEAIGRLPWLDGWLNTPSNHRAHHGVQARYQDVNYGAILMVWDRMFGTYVPESDDEPVRYGITHPIDSVNPIAVHLTEARRLWRDLVATPRWRDRLARLVRAPDWRPEPTDTQPR
jgi:sterol desaturase/sphingolipid hydroxylase (fatty acid hydroxylase superfamily)